MLWPLAKLRPRASIAETCPLQWSSPCAGSDGHGVHGHACAGILDPHHNVLGLGLLGASASPLRRAAAGLRRGSALAGLASCRCPLGRCRDGGAGAHGAAMRAVVGGEVQLGDCMVLLLGELLPHGLHLTGLGHLQQTAYFSCALPEHLLREPRPSSQRSRPRGLPPQKFIAQQQRCRSEVGGGVPHHPILGERELQEVLRKVAVRLRAAIDALEAVHEVRGRGPADLKLQNCQHGYFHSQHLLLTVCLVRDVDEVLHLWWVEFLELGCNEQGRDPHQLQVPARSVPPLQEAVDKTNG
mmetsp:Transcript_35987/g.107498  ORF Transcript_35987/g.107498 Transcript_35987/m.107498 type:complete len:298 (+) Transcript_35987:89-982(+)